MESVGLFTGCNQFTGCGVHVVSGSWSLFTGCNLFTGCVGCMLYLGHGVCSQDVIVYRLWGTCCIWVMESVDLFTGCNRLQVVWGTCCIWVMESVDLFTECNLFTGCGVHAVSGSRSLFTGCNQFTGCVGYMLYLGHGVCSQDVIVYRLCGVHVVSGSWSLLICS